MTMQILSVFAAIAVHTAPLDQIPNDAPVVTNVTGAATDPSVVSNIVESYGYTPTGAVRTITTDYLAVSNVTAFADPDPLSIVGRLCNFNVAIEVEDDRFSLLDHGTNIWSIATNSIQDRLPYPTNAIPSAVIADPPWLTEEALAFSNDYRRIDAKINWPDVTNHADFVTESVTNGILEAANRYTDTHSVVNTTEVNRLIVRYDVTNLKARIESKIPMPSSAVPPGRILAKATNGVEWIYFEGGGGGSIGNLTMVQDVTNGWHKVRVEVNPAGQLVLAVDQAAATNKFITVESEQDRAMAAELGNKVAISNQTERLSSEIVRATLVEEYLEERMISISSVGRFLSTWDSINGRPGTEPKTSPMEYKSGDYYLVAAVSQSITNYVPSGTIYTNGTSSTTFTTNSVAINDLFRFTDDGKWVHVSMAGVATTFELLAGEPRANAKLAAELDEAATNLLPMVIAETNRATAAEVALHTALTNETRRAYVAETNLAALVNAEAKRAHIAETNVAALVVAEYVRATNAEAQAVITANAYTDTTTNRFGVMIATEKGRAMLAESELDLRITAETNRAQIAERNLSTNLSAQIYAEYLRATNAEAVISAVASTALQPTDVIDNTTTAEAQKPLSANMGKELQDQIRNLQNRGRFLSVWNCVTGRPKTNPTTEPYEYRAGDYYIVGVVTNAPGVNYRPNGTLYSTNTPSTTVEAEAVHVNDTYYYDSASWSLLKSAQSEIAFASVAGSPYDNANLASALGILSNYTFTVSNRLDAAKENKIVDLATIRSGAELGSTALQSYTETDPTIYAWAKAAIKPTYTAAEVNADVAGAATSAVSSHNAAADAHPTLFAAKQNTIADLATIRSGAALGATAVQTETDPTIYAWAKAASKPTYTAVEVGADASGTATAAVGTHNSAANAHQTLFAAKQDALPGMVRGKYLHVKEGADELEWADAGGGGGGGSQIEDAAGNKIEANRTVSQALSTFSDATMTLVQTTYSTNRWEGVVSNVTKAVAWNGTVWTCEGFEVGSTIVGLDPMGVGATRIVIAQPTLGQVELMRGSSVKPYGKVVTSVEVTRQIVFDICHPVNSVWIQYTADDAPNTLFNGNGVVSTWTDVTATYSGRYFKADSSSAVGTSQGESLPKPFILNSGDHYHDMYSAWTPVADRSGYGTYAGSGAAAGAGTTYGAGLHTHGVADYGPYRDGAAVKPLTSTIKIWKRTN